MPFEELKFKKFLNVTNLKWSAPVLTANFGDGYGAGVLAGSAAGLHKWALSAEVLPDMEEYSIDYFLDDEPESDPRFTYLYEFIKRHTVAGAKPFRFKEPRTGKFYLASFEGTEFDFEVLTAKLLRGGVILNQRRARNVLFNADGSLFAAPDNFKVSPLTSTAVLFAWDAAINDNLAGYDLELDGGVYQLGNVTEYAFGSLATGSAHVARIRSRKSGGTSEWSDRIFFVVVDVGAGTPTNVNPPAPTNAVINDDLNTFGFTLAAGYLLADHEYSVDGGGSWAAVSTNPIGVGNAAYAPQQVRVRVKAATGRNVGASLWNDVPFTVLSNTKPAPPTITASDSNDTISAAHALGASEILISINDAAFAQYDGSVINVGNVSRAAGYYRFKTKAATGRDESNIVSSPAFTINPPAPTAPVTDDDANAFGFTLAVGYALADHEYSVNSGGSWAAAATNPIGVGNADYAVGQIRVRIKAAPGRLAGQQLSNAEAFTATSSSGYAVNNFTALRTLNGSTATRENLVDFALTMISDLAVIGGAPTMTLTGYSLSSYTTLRALDGETASADDLLDFVMTIASDLTAGGNLSTYSVTNFTPLRIADGASITDENLLNLMMTLADDFGATNFA